MSQSTSSSTALVIMFIIAALIAVPISNGLPLSIRSTHDCPNSPELRQLKEGILVLKKMIVSSYIAIIYNVSIL